MIEFWLTMHHVCMLHVGIVVFNKNPLGRILAVHVLHVYEYSKNIIIKYVT
jgi:hypothetical protein